jgi:hypothetical protein
MEPTNNEIEITKTESFKPNTPTKALTFLGILAAEVPAVPVNALGAVSDHVKTSPSIKAAQARVVSAESAVINGAVNTVKGMAGMVVSDKARANGMILGDKVGSFFSSVGKKAAELTPVKVVIDGATDIKNDVVETWQTAGQETIITTTETVVCGLATDGNCPLDADKPSILFDEDKMLLKNEDGEFLPDPCHECSRMNAWWKDKIESISHDEEYGEVACFNCDKIIGYSAVKPEKVPFCQDLVKDGTREDCTGCRDTQKCWDEDGRPCKFNSVINDEDLSVDTLSPRAFEANPMDPNNL